MSVRRLFLLVPVALAIAAPAAQGGTVELEGDRLLVKAGGAANRLLLRQVGAVGQVEDRAPLRTTSPGCVESTPPDGRHRVDCPLAGVDVIRVRTGAGRDRFSVGRRLQSRQGVRGNCDRTLDPELFVRTGEDGDVALLGVGDDLARGGSGADLLLGCTGDDQLVGGKGRDRLSGDRHDDKLVGKGGDDWIVGCKYNPDDSNYPGNEPGRDRLIAGPGADFLFGCRGFDRFRAGDGEDAINARDDGGEPVRCGADVDIFFGEASDERRSCEHITQCNTDNFPFFPCHEREPLARDEFRRAPRS